MDSLLHKYNNNGEFSDDETDGQIDFIRQIVDRVREEFDEVVEEGKRKTFIHLFTKILAVVLSLKEDNIEKIVNLDYFKSIKIMVRTKLVPKRIRLQMPPQKKSLYKIQNKNTFTRVKNNKY